MESPINKCHQLTHRRGRSSCGAPTIGDSAGREQPSDLKQKPTFQSPQLESLATNPAAHNTTQPSNDAVAGSQTDPHIWLQENDAQAGTISAMSIPSHERNPKQNLTPEALTRAQIPPHPKIFDPEHSRASRRRDTRIHEQTTGRSVHRISPAAPTSRRRGRPLFGSLGTCKTKSQASDTCFHASPSTRGAIRFQKKPGLPFPPRERQEVPCNLITSRDPASRWPRHSRTQYYFNTSRPQGLAISAIC